MLLECTIGVRNHDNVRVHLASALLSEKQCGSGDKKKNKLSKLSSARFFRKYAAKYCAQRQTHAQAADMGRIVDEPARRADEEVVDREQDQTFQRWSKRFARVRKLTEIERGDESSSNAEDGA